MFFEQHSVEPNLGAAHFWLTMVKGGRELQTHALEGWMENGYQALGVMEKHLAGNDFFAAGRYTIADIALYAYTHTANESTFDLTGFPSIRAWLKRVADQPGARADQLAAGRDGDRRVGSAARAVPANDPAPRSRADAASVRRGTLSRGAGGGGMRAGIFIVTMAAIAAFAGTAAAAEKEPTAVVAIGGAGEWGLPGATSFGPSVSVEFTPIRDWLEIEIGAATMFRRGVTEFETDVIFKKPFTLSDTRRGHGRRRAGVELHAGRRA